MAQQSTGDQLSSSPSGYVTRPGVVTFICITSFISITLQALGLAAYAIGQYQTANEEYFITVVIMGVVLGIFAAIVLGLWRAKNWARIAYVIVFPLLAMLEVLVDPGVVGLVRLPFVVLFCVLLFRPKASAYFRGEALPPIDPGSGLEVGERTIVRCPSCSKEIYSDLPRCHHCGTGLSHESGHQPAV